MSLLTLQREFGEWLREGDADQASAGMRIYQNNYRASLTACLADSFARTREWIGGEAFEDAMIRHIQRVPPSSWTLDAYGRDFPDTLRRIYPDDPEVAELAWLELALAEAFVGADAVALAPADAAHVDWDNAALHFTPTLDLRAVATNAHALWSALAGGEVPPAAAGLADAATLLVWRQEQVSRFRLIDMREEQALTLARSGVAFGTVCNKLVEAFGEADGIALTGAYLGQWLADGLLTTATGEMKCAA
jgi:hypothetical protein